MIYSKGIEKQKDNFDWLWDLSFNNEVDPFKFLYLLEVRNKNWTEKEIKEFCNFLRHIYFKVWNHYNGDKEKFLNFLLGLDGTPGFNILSTPIIDIGEKISCSIQTTLHVRVADLSIFPCHRTMYRDLKLGEFIYDKHQEDLIFQGQHLELNMVIPTMSSNNMPRCADCEINELCSKGCLGAQYEVTGDLFTPIPTVCNLKFAQIITLIDCLIKTDMYDKVVRAVGNKKAWQIQKLREEMENNLYDESECN